jgi:hypothetical protein
VSVGKQLLHDMLHDIIDHGVSFTACGRMPLIGFCLSMWRTIDAVCQASMSMPGKARLS